MKRKIHINWKGWIRTGVILIILFIILNFVLPLPALFPVLGDEKYWLNIWVQIIVAFLPIIAGGIKQKKYNDEKNEKEYKRILLIYKIDNAKNDYSTLKAIVENNLSVLNLVNYRKLLQQIDHVNINSVLTSKICDYQLSVSDAKDRTILYFKERENTVERMVYERIILEYSKILDKILPAAISYLNETDDAYHKNIAKSETLLPSVNDLDKLKLALMKNEGTDMIYEWKRKFISVLDEQEKTNGAKLREALELASNNLLHSENEKIISLEKELVKSK